MFDASRFTQRDAHFEPLSLVIRGFVWGPVRQTPSRDACLTPDALRPCSTRCVAGTWCTLVATCVPVQVILGHVVNADALRIDKSVDAAHDASAVSTVLGENFVAGKIDSDGDCLCAVVIGMGVRLRH